jgi:serine protease inhibitor
MNRRVLALALGLTALQCHEPSTAPTPIAHLPRDLTAAEGRLVATDNRFAFKVFRQIADSTPPDSSIFISPLSVAMALSMTYNGAAGATQQEMATALEVDGFPLDELNASYRSLIDLLRGLDRQVTFDIANSIWYRNGWSFEQTFLDANHTYFDAAVQPLDFSSPTAAQTINAWVSDRTRGKIPAIVDDPLPPEDVMYLINAIYFKGSWTQQFDKARTRPAPFLLRDGSSTMVETMSTAEPMHVRITWRPDVTVLDLPYGGQAFSMTIVIPRDAAGLDSLVATLTEERWNSWTAALGPTTVGVSLPKFRFSWGSGLEKTLSAMGMPHAFCGPWATDFTRMRAGGDVCITRVRHKAFVDVNEEGTEAAAATAVGVGVTSAPQNIDVDRPFLFAIRENLSGTILFLGRVMRPEVN